MGTSKQKRATYTSEYRREAARLVIDTDRTIAAVARDIGLFSIEGVAVVRVPVAG